MPRQALAKQSLTVALALALFTAPASAFASAPTPQGFPGLLSLTTVYTMQPCLIAGYGQSGATAGPSLTNMQRWYFSFLTQQRVIAGQVEELRGRLRENLIGTEEFLERLDPLLQRADRLYGQWKRIGERNADRPHAGQSGTPEPGRVPPVLVPRAATQATGSSADGDLRNDVAVGKCLNYLRLSIVNLFLGYEDSNGRQIEDAERQASLSAVWRSKSLTFIRALEPVSGRPES